MEAGFRFCSGRKSVGDRIRGTLGDIETLSIRSLLKRARSRVQKGPL